VAHPLSSGAAFMPRFHLTGDIIMDYDSNLYKKTKKNYIYSKKNTFLFVLPSLSTSILSSPADKLVEYK
jgi:hypothetical protein